MRLLRLVLVPLLLSVAAIIPPAAQAHGGEAVISTFPAQAPAGGEVTVFGEDLEADALMQLHLLTADGDLLVAEPMTDEAGHFSAKVTLPETLTERTYELRLTAPTGASTSTFITVVSPGAREAKGNASTSSDPRSGLLMAGVLALAGMGLVVLALRPAKGKSRGEG